LEGDLARVPDAMLGGFAGFHKKTGLRNWHGLWHDLIFPFPAFSQIGTIEKPGLKKYSAKIPLGPGCLVWLGAKLR